LLILIRSPFFPIKPSIGVDPVSLRVIVVIAAMVSRFFSFSARRPWGKNLQSLAGPSGRVDIDDVKPRRFTCLTLVPRLGSSARAPVAAFSRHSSLVLPKLAAWDTRD